MSCEQFQGRREIKEAPGVVCSYIMSWRSRRSEKSHSLWWVRRQAEEKQKFKSQKREV